MIIIEILLSCLVVIEFMKLVVEVKIVMPPEEPPLDEDIRKKLYM